MSESFVTYPQFNWIAGQEALAEAEATKAAEEVLSSQAFTSGFHGRLNELIRSWPDMDLRAFANGEMSEIYLKPVMAYFWDLKPPVYTCPEMEEFVAQDLVHLKDAICQKLKSIFESSVWSHLLIWARPRGQEAADEELTKRMSIPREALKAEPPKSMASFDSVLAAASIPKADPQAMPWLKKTYAKAYETGKNAVKPADLSEEVVSNTVIEYMTPLDDAALNDMVSLGSSSEAAKELIGMLYDEHFSSMPPLSMDSPPASLSPYNRDYFVILSYEDGAKDAIATLMDADLREYAKHALKG